MKIKPIVNDEELLKTATYIVAKHIPIEREKAVLKSYIGSSYTSELGQDYHYALTHELNNQQKQINNKLDQLIFAAFKVHGYDKDWILSPENRDRVIITRVVGPDDNVTDHYAVNEQLLFTVRYLTRLNILDYNFSANIKIEIEHCFDELSK